MRNFQLRKYCLTFAYSPISNTEEPYWNEADLFQYNFITINDAKNAFIYQTSTALLFRIVFKPPEGFNRYKSWHFL